MHTPIRTLQRRSLLPMLALALAFSPSGQVANAAAAGTGTTAAQNTPSQDGVEESRKLASEAKALIDQYSGDGPELPEAAAKLQSAIELDSGNADAYVEMARIAMKSGGLEPQTLAGAENLLRKGLASKPEHGNSYVLLGYVLVHQGKLDLAEKAFADAHRFSATSPWLGMNEGELALLRDDRKTAQQRYAGVANAAQFPASVRAQASEALAKDYAKHGEAEKARASYKQVMELAPNNAWAMGNYSRLLRVSMLDVEESEIWGRRALDRMNYGWGRENLGNTLYLKWAEALVVEKNAEKAQAAFTEAQQYLRSPAEVLHEIDEYPRAHPIIDALVKKGYSLDTFDGISGGTTPLTKAAAHPNLAIVKALLKAGADPNAPGFEGGTALMIASLGGDLQMVNVLLRAGADPTLRASDASDAESLARSANHNDVANLVKAAKSTWTPPATMKHPLKIGYHYRAKSSGIGTGDRSYSDTFVKGQVLVYAGTHGLIGRDGLPNTDIIGHSFRLSTGRKLTWAIARTEGDEAWVAMFDELGPD